MKSADEREPACDAASRRECRAIGVVLAEVVSTDVAHADDGDLVIALDDGRCVRLPGAEVTRLGARTLAVWHKTE